MADDNVDEHNVDDSVDDDKDSVCVAKATDWGNTTKTTTKAATVRATRRRTPQEEECQPGKNDQGK